MQSVNIPSISPGLRILLVEMNGVLTATLSLGFVSSETRMAFSGNVSRNAFGVASADGSIEFTVEQSAGETTSEVFPANITIGANAARMSFFPPVMLASVFASCDGSCDFELSKLCDFDSTIAGVFSMNVTLESQEGECSNVTPFASKAQWGMAVTSSLDELEIIGLGETSNFEFGALLKLDRLTQLARFETSLPGSDFEQSSSMETQIAITEQGVRISADLRRVTASGCLQHYTAEGVRQRGVSPGVSCELPSSLNCPNDVTECPDIGGAAATYEVSTSSEVSASNPKCFKQRCVAKLQERLCNDGHSARTAAAGCGAGSVVVTRREENQSSCVELSCVSGEDCGNGGAVGTLFGESCDSANVVKIESRGGACQSVRCESTTDGCPPLLNCSGFSSAGTMYIDSRGCPARRCAAGLAQITSAMTGSSYVIEGFDPPLGTESLGTRMPLARSVQSLPGASVCPRLPYGGSIPAPFCPKTGRLDVQVNNALTGGPLADAAPFEPAYYRLDEGGVCLGLFIPKTDVPIFQFQACDPTKVAACTEPAATASFLQCLPAAGTGVEVLLHVDNTSGTSGVDLTVVGGDGVNSISFAVPAADTIDMLMPLRLQNKGTPYTLTITTGAARCGFGPSGALAQDTVSLVGTSLVSNILCQ